MNNLDGLKLLQQIGTSFQRSKEIKIGEYSFVVGILSSRLEANVMGMLDKYEGIEFVNQHKVMLLSRALKSVNGVLFDTEDQIRQKIKVEVNEDGALSLEEIEIEKLKAIDNKINAVYDERLKIIQSWPMALIDRLYKEYAGMFDEISAQSKNLISSELLEKKSPSKKKK
jgi:hypothetical protein